MSKHPARVTLQTVASELGVSTAAVSFALNNRPGVSDELRRRAVETASRLGYVPDLVAAGLRTGEAKIYGLIVRNIANPFFNDLLSGMQDAAYAYGITVLATDSAYSPERERRQAELLLARRASGLAIAPIGGSDTLTFWNSHRPTARTVLINSSNSIGPGYNHVSPDSRSAVTLAFRHLRGLGHTRIALLVAPKNRVPDGDRIAVYESLCDNDRLPKLIVHTEQDGKSIIKRVMQATTDPENVTAFITNSDYSAQYVYIAAHQSGLVVGHDISIVGHDDLDTSSLLAPGLTTIRLDRKALGRAAFARLHGLENGDHVEPVSLVVRGSTGRTNN